MKLSERLEIIIREVEENGSVKVADMSKRLGCSEVTIRNDIRHLDQQGVLKKTYGGAIRKEEGLTINFSPGEYFLNSDKKQHIAQKAYDYIENRESIIIDDSTTGYYLAKHIRNHEEKRIVVITNSLVSAAELSFAKHVELFMIGGHIAGSPPSALDNISVKCLQEFNVDKAFVGVNGINLEVGLTSMGTPQMDVKREMIRRANKTFVIADSTKFGSGNLFTVCSMDKVFKIITDSDISKESLSLAKKKDINIDAI